MREYGKAHREAKMRPNQIHSCRDLSGNKDLAVMGENGKWFFIDDSVKIVGHESCSYAVGIAYCPLCGEKLMEE